MNGRTVVFLAGGSDHSVGLCSDGSLVSWGRNNYGQLGNNSTVNSRIPVVVDASDVLAGEAIIAIITGGWHTLALCSDGTMAAFGRNISGQLGNNSTTDSGVPVTVNTSGILANMTITAIGGGNAHSLALCADGSLASWGSNNVGQLGNNTNNGSGVPVEVSRSTLGSGMKFTDLATGSSASHAMALAAYHVSSNSTLSGLTVSSGTLSPAFASGTVAYTASVNNGTATLTVTPTVSEANATIQVNGTAVVSGTASAPIPLAVGPNTITVLATAQDGVTTTSYSVTVTRLSSVSTLSGLNVGGGSLIPAFSSATTAYTVGMPSVAASVTVTPTVSEANATVKVNGSTVTSGTVSAAIPLAAGINTLTVIVTAQDGVTVTSYVLSIDNSSYGVWKSSVFTNPADLNNPAVSSEMATPANDGITNLMKYALALTPMSYGTGGLPTASPQDGYLTLTYRRNKTATDVVYTVQSTDSLIDIWTPATTVTSQSDQGTYTLVTVRDTVPSSGNPHRFMRLQVSR